MYQLPALWAPFRIGHSRSLRWCVCVLAAEAEAKDKSGEKEDYKGDSKFASHLKTAAGVSVFAKTRTLKEQREYRRDRVDLPGAHARVTALSDTEARLRRREVACEVLAEPLLDEHAERCGREAEDETREPQGVHSHRDGGRRVHDVDNRGGVWECGGIRCVEEAGSNGIAPGVRGNLAEKASRFGVVRCSGIRGL